MVCFVIISCVTNFKPRITFTLRFIVQHLLLAAHLATQVVASDRLESGQRAGGGFGLS